MQNQSDLDSVAQTRRHYDNPTRPMRCVAVIPDKDGGVASKCRDRIYYGGLCGKHYEDGEKYREVRRKTVTRHRLGMDIDGHVAYGTIDPSVEIHYCHVTNCRRVPIINLSDTLYCEAHFMSYQRKRQKESVVNADVSITSHESEESGNDQRGINGHV